MQKQAVTVKQFQVSAILEYDTVVTIEATSEDEARQKFESADWVDEGQSMASLINWKAIGRFKESA